MVKVVDGAEWGILEGLGGPTQVREVRERCS
jgi:hypothetical protein